jgi:methionyl-tRNA formyltransferase
MMSAVKQCAIAHDIPVYQPATLKDAQVLSQLQSLNADVMIVVAYGLILPAEVLKTPRYGCVNVHGSLLPAWRGASPIQSAILAGDAQTGVTIMQMDVGMDTGPALLQSTCPILSNDTSMTLAKTLSELGAQSLLTVVNSLPEYLSKAIPQNNALATHAPKIQKNDANIDWSKPASLLDQQIRAYQPWPVACTMLQGELIKIHAAQVVPALQHMPPPGTLVAIHKDSVEFATGDACLRITRVQFPGGRVLSVKEALNGRPDTWVVGAQCKEVPHVNVAP